LGVADLKDGNMNPMGFAVYCSEVINQSHNFVQNPEMQCLGVMPALEGNSLVDLTTSMSVKIKTTAAIDGSNYLSFPSADDQVQLKIYAISPDGMYACVGEIRIDVDPR
jgi:hypothetical protein